MRRLLLLATLLLAAFPSPARVFWQFGGGRSSGAWLDADEAGWTRGYTAPLRINGGSAEVSVWSTDQSPGAALATLRGRIESAGGAFYAADGGDLAWGIACADGKVTRFLISGGATRSSQVFQLVQDFEAYRRSRQPPATAGLPDVPELPGARVSQVLANEKSGLTLAQARCAENPASAHQRVNALLAGAGWQLMLGGGSQAGIYIRNHDLLVASALSAGSTGETLITLAHKRQGAGDLP